MIRESLIITYILIVVPCCVPLGLHVETTLWLLSVKVRVQKRIRNVNKYLYYHWNIDRIIQKVPRKYFLTFATWSVVLDFTQHD